MTTRPELSTDIDLFSGLVALGLFAIMAVVFLGAAFGSATGFAPDAFVTKSIGYALVDLESGMVGSEGFLAALLIVAFVLDAALGGAVMLARREGGEP